MCFVKLENITKIYNVGKENELKVLDCINIEISEGDFVTIVGESGSGKSTLLNIIGAIDKPTSGKYYFQDKDITKYNEKEICEYRNKSIGFVFQSFYLMSNMNALKNVMLPMVYCKVPKRERQKRAIEALEMVGMSERMYHKPNQLSGGQNQRVAIARAIVNNPKIILADEPTGALDQKNSKLIMQLLKELNERHNITVIMITHSIENANIGNKKFVIEDGKIKER